MQNIVKANNVATNQLFILLYILNLKKMIGQKMQI
jgi:hypothetical protein